MAEYKHGTYGEFAESIGEVATQSGTVAVYVGIAPINLIRGYGKYVNTPVKLTDFETVKRTMGYSKNWAAFDLCEAFKVHFDNEAGNVGPIVAINVLDPATHKKNTPTTASLTFVNGRAVLKTDTIILDTFVIADSVEGVDYNVSYDFSNGQVVITAIGDALTGTVSATYSEVDTSAITESDIIGDVTESGVYTGLGCINLIYQENGLIPNLIASVGWSEKPDVYKAMIAAGTKVNGHWDAFVYADIPIAAGDAKIDTISSAKKWKTDNGYTHERSKVFWPKVSDNAGNIYHASSLGVWRTMLVDASHNGIPMESPSNKAVPVAKQYFGEGSTNRGFDQNTGNSLNADGITTIVYWGGRWVLWGPHTAAYKFGEVGDNRAIFDTSIRMMMYVSNDFQREHALVIDSPMTRAMADTIKNREQEKMDALAAVGAFIGTPKVDFLQSDNSTSEMVQGNFVFANKNTPTPPFKSGALRVAYTTEGFNAYFGEVE